MRPQRKSAEQSRLKLAELAASDSSASEYNASEDNESEEEWVEERFISTVRVRKQLNPRPMTQGAKRPAEPTAEVGENSPDSASGATTKKLKPDLEEEQEGLELIVESDDDEIQRTSGTEDTPEVDEVEDPSSADGGTFGQSELAQTIAAAEAYRAAVRAEMQRTKAENAPEVAEKAIAFREGFSCENCMKLFSSESSLKVHQGVCGEVMYRCKLCWEDTDEPVMHMEEHWRCDPPPELRYNPCLTVEKDMKLIKAMYMLRVEPDEQWLCLVCTGLESMGHRQDGWPTSFYFGNRTRLWIHQSTHHGIAWKNLTCQACGGWLKFHTRMDYLRHMFAMHVQLKKEEKKFCCLLCGELHDDRGVLEIHLFMHAKMPTSS